MRPTSHDHHESRSTHHSSERYSQVGTSTNPSTATNGIAMAVYFAILATATRSSRTPAKMRSRHVSSQKMGSSLIVVTRSSSHHTCFLIRFLPHSGHRSPSGLPRRS